MDEIERRLLQITERLGKIEVQLAALSKQAGLAYDPPFAEAPPEVLELARAGNQIAAIQKYRELTGADIETARNFVSGL